MSNENTNKYPQEIIDFLNGVEHKTRREDSFTMLEILSRLSPNPPELHGSIIGFGMYHYKYDSGREGDSVRIGFSPRKQSLTIYIINGFDRYTEILERIGKHKTSKVCLYVNKLKDLNMNVLEELLSKSIEHFEVKYGKYKVD